MGKAMENYLGQFGNYYPGSLSWDGTNSRTKRDQIYRDVERGENVYLVKYAWMNSVEWERAETYYMHFSCVGHGQQPDNGISGTSTPPPTDDRLKVAPYGMGLLLTTGVLPEAKVWYCPSGRNVSGNIQGDTFELDQETKWSWAMPYSSGIYRGGYPHDDLRHWLSAGGTDAKTLTHGTWQRWFAPFGDGRSRGLCAAVLSQYAYRNQPVIPDEWPTSDKSLSTPAAPWDDATFSVPYTQPSVSSTYNCPPFKTPKALKGRALVSDSFAKGFGYRPHSDLAKYTIQPGYADDVHQDGYNVLTGDYAVKWYSDQEKRIIYWAWDGATSYYQTGLWTTSAYAEQGTYVYSYARQYQMPLVWHTLDESLGIDLGAPYNSP